jgi:hypothetical protein
MRTGRDDSVCLLSFLAVFFVIAFLAVPAGITAAQSRGGFIIYVAPASGGTIEDRDFFYQNIEMELLGASYEITRIEEDADYTFSIFITGVENEENPSLSLYILTLVLIDNANGQEMVRLGWEYQYREEMYEWNLYLIYQALANLPIRTVNTEVVSGETGALWEKVLYLGLRAGFLANFFSVRKTVNYEAGQSQAFGFEGALVMELRPFRFFSFQGEVIFAVDAFNAGKQIVRNNQSIYSSENFTTFSLAFPLLIKLPLKMGDFTLSFYGGAYYVLTLGTGGEEESQSMKMAPPVGLTLGVDLGFRAGPGEFFIDLRYGADLGATRIGDGGGVSYTRQRGGVSVGYKIGFWNRNKRENRIEETEEAVPAEEAGNEEMGNEENQVSVVQPGSGPRVV